MNLQTAVSYLLPSTLQRLMDVLKVSGDGQLQDLLKALLRSLIEIPDLVRANLAAQSGHPAPTAALSAAQDAVPLIEGSGLGMDPTPPIIPPDKSDQLLSKIDDVQKAVTRLTDEQVTLRSEISQFKTDAM